MSFFEKVKPFPPDPIFGLGNRFKKDKNPNVCFSISSPDYVVVY